MTPLAKDMWLVSVAAWFVAIAGWFYGARYWLPRDRREGYGRKSLKGFGVFLAALAVFVAAGGMALLWGGG